MPPEENTQPRGLLPPERLLAPPPSPTPVPGPFLLRLPHARLCSFGASAVRVAEDLGTRRTLSGSRRAVGTSLRRLRRTEQSTRIET